MSDKNKEEKKVSAETEEVKTDDNINVAEEETPASAETVDNNGETSPDEKTESETDPLEAAQQQMEQLKDQLLRTVAEFENYKKRTVKEKAELIQNGGAKTVKAILPVLDDFERAIADQSEDPKAIKEGITMIFNKFIKTLESVGVRQIDTQDQLFDTDYHEAVAMVPGMGDDKKGKVVDCVQTGYMMNDRVIRHAKVAVAD